MAPGRESLLVLRTLYRSLLATTRSLEGPLRLRLPLDQSVAQWMIGRGQQQYGYVPARSVRTRFTPNVPHLLFTPRAPGFRRRVSFFQRPSPLLERSAVLLQPL